MSGQLTRLRGAGEWQGETRSGERDDPGRQDQRRDEQGEAGRSGQRGTSRSSWAGGFEQTGATRMDWVGTVWSGLTDGQPEASVVRAERRRVPGQPEGVVAGAS